MVNMAKLRLHSLTDQPLSAESTPFFSFPFPLSLAALVLISLETMKTKWPLKRRHFSLHAAFPLGLFERTLPWLQPHPP